MMGAGTIGGGGADYGAELAHNTPLRLWALPIFFSSVHLYCFDIYSRKSFFFRKFLIIHLLTCTYTFVHASVLHNPGALPK